MILTFTGTTRLRSHVVGRLGFDTERPIVTVFNHAVSDALGTNRELFPSLADWFADTAAYAAEHPEAQWLFLDHPSQALYDSTGFFDSVAATHRRTRHLAFRPSATLSKNALWSLTDLGVTVRGSVSNELPAYGIPVIQARLADQLAARGVEQERVGVAVGLDAGHQVGRRRREIDEVPVRAEVRGERGSAVGPGPVRCLADPLGGTGLGVMDKDVGGEIGVAGHQRRRGRAG